MNSYIAHAYEAERARQWASSKDMPARIVLESIRPRGTRRFRYYLAVLLIAGTAMFGALGPETGSAHTLPPCFGWSTAHQMSVRQPTTIRHRHIPVHTIQRLYCRLFPGDPLNQNRAVIIHHNA